ncbi:MAG: hypothetical protein PUC37_11095 [Spirochaetales bacterium]|nr:hypothetical protein [Spirochaetales bacterium]
MYNPSQIQKITHATVQSSQKVLHEGSSVNVRIIADKGNGSYVGTVAGARVNIHSAKNLVAGKSFPATVSIKNGTVYVIPKDQIFGDSALELINIKAKTAPMSAEILAQKLNLPFDELMSNIINYSKQMELKLDPEFLLKVKNLSLKFKGKEISASKLLLLLAQKKIELSDEQIISLLEFLDNYSDEDFQNENSGSKDSINKINSIHGCWYIVPFELVRINGAQLDNIKSSKEVDEEKKLAVGISKFFYSTDNQLKIINLECKKTLQKYYFNLLFEKNVCKKIQFCIQAEESQKLSDSYRSEKSGFIEDKINLIFERLKKFNAEIEYVEKSEIENYLTEEAQYFSFESEV